MKLIIDIPEDLYKRSFMSNDIWDMRMAGFVCSAIKNGTPIPDNATVCDIEQIRAEIERLHYHPKLDFIKNDDVVEMALEIIDKYKGDKE